MFLVIVLLMGTIVEENNWELRKDQNGIKVYTAALSGSSFKAFRADMEIEGHSTTEITAAILDVENYVNIIPNNRESKVIKEYSDAHDIHYSYSDAPWPVSDRDGIYEMKAVYLQNEGKVRIDLEAIKDYPDVPHKKGVVRMVNGEGYWEVIELGEQKHQIVYQYHADPGGNIPSWLANSVIVDTPFKMFLNLRSELREGKYKDSHLDFITSN